MIISSNTSYSKNTEYIINLYDQHPDARVVDVIESLTKSFENFNLKETSVHNFIRNELQFVF